MHALNNFAHSSSGHHQCIMQQNAVDIQALQKNVKQRKFQHYLWFMHMKNRHIMIVMKYGRARGGRK